MLGAYRLGSTPKCDHMLLICSAEPRGLCGDPRIFDGLTKVPQVFRNPGGSPLLKMDDPKSLHTGMNAYSTRAIECSDFSDHARTSVE
jgi:hypothetical protein